MIPGLDQRPIIVALAGPNGAGKSTFYGVHLEPAGLRLINADVFSKELRIDPYQAAQIAGALRNKFVELKESFVFETVFSDPVGDKLDFLKNTAAKGYNVILCFIGIAGPETSEERVAMRVSQGGHDVPTEKLAARFPRTLENLKKSIPMLPRVFVFDNQDLANPFRKVAIFHQGKAVYLADKLPSWMPKIDDSCEGKQ